jgi:hypothetical protein
MQSAYFGSISIRCALRPRRSHPIKVLPEPPNKSATISPALLLLNNALHEFYRLGRRMNPIRRWLLLLPQRRLRFVAVPGIFLPRHVGLEHRLVLEFVASEAPSEGIFGPNNLTAYFEAGGLQHVLKLTLP